MKVEKHLITNAARTLVVFFVLIFASFWAGGISMSQASQEKVNELLKKATYVGMEVCATCHEKQFNAFKLSTHAKFVTSETEGVANGCETCHGPGSLHAESGGGKGNNIINPRKDPEICFTCHTEKRMEFKLPFRHPVLEGKMSCADCHDLHGDAKITATSMEDKNDVCFKCHKDKRGPYVYPHDAMEEGCTTCHKVHGSITDKMLLARDQNLCLRCHIGTDFPKIGGPSGSSHGSRLSTGSTCWSGGCHISVHGSNFDHHLFK